VIIENLNMNINQLICYTSYTALCTREDVTMAHLTSMYNLQAYTELMVTWRVVACLQLI